MDEVTQIQDALVAKARAEKIAHQNSLKRDIRSQIARSGWYKSPEGDHPNPEYQEFPKLVYLDEARTKYVLVHNSDEEDQVLNRKETRSPPKAQAVNINELVKADSAPEKRRGRPPKAKPQDLPPDLT